MDILIVNGKQVRQLLPMTACIDVMAEALKLLAQGGAQNPLRTMMWLPDRHGLLVAMPSSMDAAMGIKIISVMPGNHGTEFDSHMGVVLLFETQHGRPLALIDASEITAIRTAAVSGVATRVLARENASDLAILGTGVQADSHLEAVRAVREIKRVRVWSRHAENRERFARHARDHYGIHVEPMETAEAAVIGAEIICTTTASSEPVLKSSWLSPGTHLNVVGASTPNAREVDSETMRMARLFVDRRESALNEAGDFLIPKREGVIGDDHILAEVGEVLIGKHPGRTSPDEVTLFKSLGLAVEDLASAQYIYEQAVKQGIGTAVEFGSARGQAH